MHPTRTLASAGAVAGLAAGAAEGVLAGGGPLTGATLAGLLALGGAAAGLVVAAALALYPRDLDERGGAWLFAGLPWTRIACAAGLLALAVAALAWQEHWLPSPPRAALARAAGLLVVAAPAAAAGALALPPRAAWVVWAGAALAWLAYPPLRVVPFGPLVAPAAAVGGLLVAFAAPLLAARLAVAGALLGLPAAWLVLTGLPDHPEVRIAALERAPLGGRVLAALERTAARSDAAPARTETPPPGLAGGAAPVAPAAPAVPAALPARPAAPGGALGPGPAPGRRWSFLLVTVDTLRWDHVGAYGYARPTTPRIDAFAEGATVFERAWAQGPQTKASVPSMLTGRYFSEVDRSNDLWVRVHPGNPVFPEALRDAGWRTSAVLSHFFFRRRHGCDRGFDEWDLSPWQAHKADVGKAETSSLVTDRAIAALDRHASGDAPLFLWAHYFDPHHPYVRHPGAPDFGGGRADLYDAEIAHVDAHVGRLLDHLDGARWADEMVVVIHSDHGEGLGDKGYVYHGIHIYEDQLRVPLLIRVPGRPGRRVRTGVGLIDIAPTVLEMAGATLARSPAGTSLVPWLALRPGDPEPARGPVFSEMVQDAKHSSRKVMIDWPWKLHRSVTYRYDELFHLEDDPAESRNRAKTDPQTYDRLRSRLGRWMEEELQSVKPGRLGTGESDAAP